MRRNTSACYVPVAREDAAAWSFEGWVYGLISGLRGVVPPKLQKAANP